MGRRMSKCLGHRLQADATQMRPQVCPKMNATGSLARGAVGNRGIALLGGHPGLVGVVFRLAIFQRISRVPGPSRETWSDSEECWAN